MLLRSLLACLTAVLAAPAFAASTVLIGVPSWPSAQVTAHIVGQLVEDHLDRGVRYRDIGTVQLFGAIDRGEVDVHPEVWLPNLDRFVAEFVDERGTMTLTGHSVPASQQLCTTEATVEATGLTRVSDLADPAVASQFDTNDDGLGEMWIGDFEWSSTRIERVRAKSYGYADTMMLLTMPEDVAMAAVDAAVAVGTPIVFFCYAPHHMFALHDLVTLEEPAHDPDTWRIVQPEEDPAWLSRSRAESAWAPAAYHIGYASDLTEYEPDVAALLEAIRLTREDAQAMSYAVIVEGRAPEAVAATFIAQNQDRVEEWVQ